MAERPLHIAVDGRELVGRATGVGRYLREVLHAWLATGTGDRYSIVVPTEPPSDVRDPEGRITWVVEPARIAGTWWEQTRLSRAVRRLSPHVLFAPGYTAPLFSRVPFVLTVHDVSFWAHPEWFSKREGLRRRTLTRASARRAALVTTVSEFSKSEIVRWLGLPPERIVVAPNGRPPVDPPASAERPPVVLFVGSLFNRRRIPELIAGFARAAARVPAARLVIVGDNRTQPPQDPLAIAADFGVADRVEWLAYVDDDRLLACYRQARVFAFLSDYEGFGLTPLEAIARGVPVVALDTPLSREVYRAGARLVAPDAASIGDALTLLLIDPQAHGAALEAGRRQLERYSWTRTGQVIRDALGRAAHR